MKRGTKRAPKATGQARPNNLLDVPEKRSYFTAEQAQAGFQEPSSGSERSAALSAQYPGAQRKSWSLFCGLGAKEGR
jgi:hypothetical protein